MQEKTYKASIINQIAEVFISSFVITLAGAFVVGLLCNIMPVISFKLYYYLGFINRNYKYVPILIIICSIIYTFILKNTKVIVTNNKITIIQGGKSHEYNINTPIVLNKKSDFTYFIFNITNKYEMKINKSVGLDEYILYGFDESTVIDLKKQIQSLKES